MMEGKIPNLNLVKQVNPEAPARQPYVYKPIIFDAFTVVAAYVSGWAYSQYLGDNIQGTLLLGVLGVFTALGALQVLFTKSLGRRFTVLILETAAMLFPFYRYDLRVLGVIAGVMLIFRLWGEVRGRSELENGLEIRFLKATMPALKKLTTALAIALVILYLPRWKDENIFISKNNFQSFFGWTAAMVKNFYPEFDLNSSVGKLAEDFARAELQGDQTFKSLPPQNQEAAVRQAGAQITESIEKRINKKISAAEPAADLFYDFIVGALKGWKNQFQDWFLVAWAIAVFAAIRGFGFIFYWLAGFVAFILYQILLSFGFIHLIGESRTHEVIEF